MFICSKKHCVPQMCLKHGRRHHCIRRKLLFPRLVPHGWACERVCSFGISKDAMLWRAEVIETADVVMTSEWE